MSYSRFRRKIAKKFYDLDFHINVEYKVVGGILSFIDNSQYGVAAAVCKIITTQGITIAHESAICERGQIEKIKNRASKRAIKKALSSLGLNYYRSYCGYASLKQQCGQDLQSLLSEYISDRVIAGDDKAIELMGLFERKEN